VLCHNKAGRQAMPSCLASNLTKNTPSMIPLLLGCILPAWSISDTTCLSADSVMHAMTDIAVATQCNLVQGLLHRSVVGIAVHEAFCPITTYISPALVEPIEQLFGLRVTSPQPAHPGQPGQSRPAVSGCCPAEQGGQWA
jgi:hypothetical protein